MLHSLPFWTIKIIDVMDGSCELLDVLTSLPVSHAILPRDVCFATSHPAKHVTCSYIRGSGYAYEPIKRYLFIDNKITDFVTAHDGLK